VLATRGVVKQSAALFLDLVEHEAAGPFAAADGRKATKPAAN
jgi:hypothetical protein